MKSVVYHYGLSAILGSVCSQPEDTSLNIINKLLDIVKTLFAESLENLLVAGSCLFLILSFFTAFVEPKAALFTLAVGVAFYALARLKDKA